MLHTESTASDRERFEALFMNNVDFVLAYALARTDPHTAQDVVSDTFLTAWRRLGEIPNPSKAWLIGVARRSLSNQRRGRRRQQSLQARLRSAAEPPVSDAYSIDGPVMIALRRLRSSDRELLCLLAWDGLHHSEAALVLGCSTKTFAVRLHRARRRFESALSDGGVDLLRQSDDESNRPMIKEVP